MYLQNRVVQKTFRVKWRKTHIMAIKVLFVVDLIVEVGWDGVDGF